MFNIIPDDVYRLAPPEEFYSAVDIIEKRTLSNESITMFTIPIFGWLSFLLSSPYHLLAYYQKYKAEKIVRGYIDVLKSQTGENYPFYRGLVKPFIEQSKDFDCCLRLAQKSEGNIDERIASIFFEAFSYLKKIERKHSFQNLSSIEGKFVKFAENYSNLFSL